MKAYSWAINKEEIQETIEVPCNKVSDVVQTIAVDKSTTKIDADQMKIMTDYINEQMLFNKAVLMLLVFMVIIKILNK